MKLIPESLNELYNFEKGGTPLDKLQIGRRQTLKKESNSSLKAVDMYLKFVDSGISVDELYENGFNAKNKENWTIYFIFNGKDWHAYVQGYSSYIDVGTYDSFEELFDLLNSIDKEWMIENDPKRYQWAEEEEEEELDN